MHDVPDPKPRREIERVAISNNAETEAKRARHSSLVSVVGNLKQMTLNDWKFEEHETLIRLSLYDNQHVLPKFQVTIYSSLKFRVSVFGWNLIISHPLYTQNEQSVKFLSLRYLLDTLESFTLCDGVPKESCAVISVEDPTGSYSLGKNIIVRHAIPVFQDPQEDLTTDVERLPFKVSSFFRTEKCEMLCPPNVQICNSCSIANAQCINELKKKNLLRPFLFP